MTIRLKDRVVTESSVQHVRLKFDPGSKGTGIAVTRESEGVTIPLWQGELQHRGSAIRKALGQRAAYRRRRRSANLRYRAPRFLNRRRPAGWLAPSLQHRVDGIRHWVQRLRNLVPLADIWVENVRFDMQLMANPEIRGTEYQQGTLQGYEVREYLLEKFGRKCVYCGVEDVPFQVEHVVPKAKGGSDRVTNLVLSCCPCNQKKGAKDLSEFLRKKPEILKRVLAQLKSPLKDAAAVNATRWAVWNELRKFGLPVRGFSGGRTKWNRVRLQVPKAHSLDALCVGEVESVVKWDTPVLVIQARGRGSHCRTDTDKFGFPRKSIHGKISYGVGKKRHDQFQTGVFVRLVNPKGPNAGTFIGHLNVRSDGTAYLTVGGRRVSATLKRCKRLQASDGYKYEVRSTPVPKPSPTVGDLLIG